MLPVIFHPFIFLFNCKLRFIGLNCSLFQLWKRKCRLTPCLWYSNTMFPDPEFDSYLCIIILKLKSQWWLHPKGKHMKYEKSLNKPTKKRQKVRKWTLLSKIWPPDGKVLHTVPWIFTLLNCHLLILLPAVSVSFSLSSTPGLFMTVSFVLSFFDAAYLLISPSVPTEASSAF